MEDITANTATLLRQASMTADEYLTGAVRNIDEQFRAGYAAKHPKLVAAMVQAASADFNHAVMKLAAQDIRDGLYELARAKQGQG